MKYLVRPGFGLLLALSLLANSIRAEESTINEAADAASASKLKFSYETNLDYSYVGDASTRLGHGRTGDVAEQSNLVHFVVSPQWDDGPLYRFGLEYQRYSFGLPRLAALPNTLQSVSAIVGVDLQFFDSWLVRVEAQPGFYGDAHLDGNDFNAPFLIGGSYIASASLQWIAGLGVDVNRKWPVIPAIGLRWSFLDRWVLDAILPTPRLEYQYSSTLTLFVGADLKDGTFRVDGRFGDSHGRPALNHGLVEYDEIRVGAGASWKAAPAVSFEVEGGYLPYREFDFHRAGESFRTDSGAPYTQVSLDAKF